MLDPLRRVGGTVTLHDWVLFDLAVAAHPELERGGWRGHVAAWRCGGLEQRQRWVEALRARRAGVPPEARAADGPLLHGWHEPEADGRWCAPRAGLPRPVLGVQEAIAEVPRTKDCVASFFFVHAAVQLRHPRYPLSEAARAARHKAQAAAKDQTPGKVTWNLTSTSHATSSVQNSGAPKLT